MILRRKFSRVISKTRGRGLGQCCVKKVIHNVCVAEPLPLSKIPIIIRATILFLA